VPKKFAGAAQLQISFGNFETVVSAYHGVKARAGIIGQEAGSDQNAMRFLRAAADAAAQLVQLRKTETFCVFNHHNRGVGNVHTDFDDRGGDQNLRVVFF